MTLTPPEASPRLHALSLMIPRSPGMTAVEKILAAKSGKASVRAGDVVYPDPDFIGGFVRFCISVSPCRRTH